MIHATPSTKAKTTLVIGASTNPERYSFKAISLLQRYQHPVVAVGLRQESVLGIPIEKNIPNNTDIHTVTLYVNPTLQQQYYTAILALQPQRIIFNPGTENPELAALANEQNIATLDACTLVLLSTGQY